MKLYKVLELSTMDEHYFKQFKTLSEAYNLNTQVLRNRKTARGLPIVQNHKGGYLLISEIETE